MNTVTSNVYKSLNNTDKYRASIHTYQLSDSIVSTDRYMVCRGFDEHGKIAIILKHDYSSAQSADKALINLAITLGITFSNQF